MDSKTKLRASIDTPRPRPLLSSQRSASTHNIQAKNTWKSPTRSGTGSRLLQKRERHSGASKEIPAFFYDCDEFTSYQNPEEIEPWRLQQRKRCVAIGMILSLNLRVSPPGAAPSPRAREEAGIIPSKKKSDGGMEKIIQNLTSQYLNICPKTSRNSRSFVVKHSPDPSVDKVKSLCVQLRTFAKDKRIIIHYNGHGVPEPSSNGEIWVFNRELTQYIPLSLYDLQGWIGGPSMLIFDCGRGGLIIEGLQKFTEQRKDENERNYSSVDQERNQTSQIEYSDYYAMVACAANETIPSNPKLPADLLTSCLTTPIKMSLQYSSSRSILQYRFNQTKVDYQSLIEKIPGSLDDRQTPKGELNWIFTAVTEAIAWEVVSPSLFQKLFREDPVVASLFRNFLLADRILRDSQCTPSSHPRLPPTHFHPMWKTWDQVLDVFLEQLPRVVRQVKSFVPSSFFSVHLTAFEIWLECCGDHKKHHPRELPIVLQALLSPIHRIRALKVFKEFLDLGIWAVSLSLAVGIFHYVLRLLQRATGQSVSILIFIWTKIIAADYTLQIDLVKGDAHLFFIKILRGSEYDVQDRVRAAFILSVIMADYPDGQMACLQAKLVPTCSSLLNHSHAPLRKWAMICIAKICENNVTIKNKLIQTCKIQDMFLQRMHDQVPDNRAVVLFAIGTFIATGNTTQDFLELDLALSMKELVSDISPLVRQEFVVTLSHLIYSYEAQFLEIVMASAKQELISISDEERSKLRRCLSSDFGRLWRIFFSLQYDPMPPIRAIAEKVVLGIHGRAITELTTQNLSSEDQDRMKVTLRNVITLPQSQQLPSSPRVTKSSSSSGTSSMLKQLGWRRTSHLKQTPTAKPTLEPPSSPKGTPRSSMRRSVSQMSIIEQPRTADHRASIMRGQDKGETSELFPRSCEKFNFPNLHAEQTASSPIKVWKVMEQEKMLEAMSELSSQVASHKLETQAAALVNEPYHVSKLLVHPFYPVIVSTSTNDVVRVWDWKQKILLNKFSNTNTPGTFVSSLSFVNLLEPSDMLMTGSSDGVMRVWKTYHQNGPPVLCTAWRAHKQPDNSSSMCHLWNQRSGVVLTAGEYPVMRMWDVAHGIAVSDIPTDTTSCITCMAQEEASSPIVIAGDSEGNVRVFDCRVSSRYALVKTYKEHDRSIINVEMMTSSKKIVSGCVGGDVRFFDLRSPDSTFHIKAHTRSAMASLAVHTQAPIIATGTQNQTIKLTNHSGERLNDIKYYSKYLGARIGAVSCLQFHPIQPLLVAGNTDGVVAVYQSSVVSHGGMV